MPSVDNSTLFDTSKLALRIREARLAARLSQAELAEKIHVSDKSISAYEKGRSTPPFKKLKQIALETKHPLTFFTEDINDNAVISSKLENIERELKEIKQLLKSK